MPSPIKILHTSDLHLDSRFCGITDPGLRARRRREHREVVRRIVDLAREEDVDLLLFVGDLFEDSTYQFETIAYLVEEFRRMHPKPVFIAPGLSDAYHSRSPYSLFEWGENVHIFGKDTFSSLCLTEVGATVHGAASDREHLEENPLKGIQAVNDGSIEIGMVYGSNLDRVPEGAESPFPFHEQDARATGVHFLALGGYHTFQKFGKKPIGCYPGMPEGTGFSELGEKVVVLAELDGKKVTLQRRSVSQRTFDDVLVDLSGLEKVDAVVRTIEAALEGKDRADAVIRVRLTGRPGPSVPLDAEDLAERVHLERGILQIVDETWPVPDWHEVGRRKTLAGEFARAMQGKFEKEGSARYEKVRDYGLGALIGKGNLRLGKPPAP